MGLLGTSFRVARLFGIDIRIHVLFVFWIAFELFTSGSGWTVTATWLGLLFGTVLLHELGHCFGARAVEGEADQIILWPLGGLALARAPMTPWAQFVTVAAGPAVNLLFCLTIGGYMLSHYGGAIAPWLGSPFLGDYELPAIESITHMYLLMLYQINWLLLAFNLLPIYPMDGGQLFQCLLWPFVGLHRAMTVACQVGLLGAAGLALWGFSGGATILIFIAIFGATTCWQRLQMLNAGYIVDESVRRAPYRVVNPRRRGLLARMLGRKPRARPAARPVEPPREPSPIEASAEPPIDPRAALEAEVDRILEKVQREGINSLTYTEQQTLRRATALRQQCDEAQEQSGANSE